MPESLSLYIHLPFCLHKCGYCDFFSEPVVREAVPHEAYAEAVKRQLALEVAGHGLAGRRVMSVYFGGGTPSLLPPVFFRTMLDTIPWLLQLDSEAEISAEFNPATADAAWCSEMREAGVTRLSIGVQSFSPRLLTQLGRLHGPQEAMEAIASAQEAGFDTISLDLMVGIPGERMAEVEEDLRTAMTFQPEHLSLYAFTPEIGTPLGDAVQAGELAMLEDEAVLAQLRTGMRMLTRGGRKRYEISNCARPGQECLHNLHYWHYGDYLGLGAGATSFPQLAAGSEAFGRRWTQQRDVSGYLSGSAALAEEEFLDIRTAMGEYCFLGLRTSEGLSMSAFEQRFGHSFEALFGESCRQLEQERLLEWCDDQLRLTAQGVELSNQVFLRFLP